MAILLSRGGKNIPAEVQRWQYFLLKNKIPQVGKIDADFGMKTEQATKIFQIQVGLSSNGRLDESTHAAAVAMGYRDLTVDYYDKRKGLQWPKEPKFGSPGNVSRNKAFKCFKFILQPRDVRPDHETIVIRGACDGSTNDWVKDNIIDIEIPQLSHVEGYAGRFRCHRKVAPKAQQLFAKWEEDDLLHLLITYAGAFVARYIRDTPLPNGGHGSKSSADESKLSNHAFGSAFDINATWNPRVSSPRPPEVTAKGSVRLLVPAANALGFYWGGHYEPPTKFDGMHFEFADFDKL